MNRSAVSKLPPYADALGIVADGMEGDMPRLCCGFSDRVVGRPGMWHGGALAGLLEMAAMAVLHHALDARGEPGDLRIKPVNATVDFMRGAGERPVFGSGRVLRIGRTIATVEAFAWQDGPDRPVATLDAHYLLARAAG